MSDDEGVSVSFPLGWRIIATLFLGSAAIIFGAFLSPLVEADLPSRIVMFPFALFCSVAAVRAATGPQVLFHDDRVVFRKMARTQTFDRAGVAEFEPGPWSFNGVQKVALRMADGSVKNVPLDGPMGRGKRFQRILNEGNAWLGHDAQGSVRAS